MTNTSLATEVEQILTQCLQSIQENEFTKLLSKRDHYEIFIQISINLEFLYSKGVNINPYPELYQRLRTLNIKPKQCSVPLPALFSSFPVATNTKHLFKQYLLSSDSQFDLSTFGVYAIVKYSNPKYFLKLRDLASEIVPMTMKTITLVLKEENFPIQMLLSVCGKSMFLGTIFNELSHVEFKVDVLVGISDTEIDLVPELFYKAVSEQFVHIEKNLSSTILDIRIPNAVYYMAGYSSSSDKPPREAKTLILTYSDWKNKYLDVLGILKSVYAMLFETQSNNDTNCLLSFVTLQVLVPVHKNSMRKESDIYEKAIIHYHPIAMLRQKDVNNKEIWKTAYPNKMFATEIFNRLFLNQDFAETFMTLLFHDEVCRHGSEAIAPVRSDVDIFDSRSSRGLFGIFTINSHQSQNVKENQNPVENDDLESSELSQYRNVHKLAEQLWISDILEQSTAFDESSLWSSIIKLLVLKCASTDDINQDQLITELHGLFSSQFCIVFKLIEVNKLIRQLVFIYGEKSEDDFLLLKFKEFQKMLNEVTVHSKLREFSSFTKAVIRSVQQRLSKWFQIKNTEELLKELVKQQYMMEMSHCNVLLHALLWHTTKSSLENMRLNTILKAAGIDFTDDDKNFPNPTISLQGDDINEFLILKGSTASDSEYVTMETYLLMHKFDLIWKRFLVILLRAIENCESVDPFVILIEQFSRQSIETDLQMRALQRSPLAELEPVCVGNLIMKAAKAEIYGIKSALLLLDPGAMSLYTTLLRQVDHQITEIKTEHYEVRVSNGFVGNLSYFGSVDPFLGQIDTVDNIYIKSPVGCIEEAAQIFADIVVKHFMELHKSLKGQNYIILELSLPGSNQKWNYFDLQPNTRDCVLNISKTVRSWNSVFLTIMAPTTWRFVPVVKHFRFHFLGQSGRQHLEYDISQNHVLEPYRMIFLSQRSAELYYSAGGFSSLEDNAYRLKNTGPIIKRIDQIVREHLDGGTSLKLYRAVITKSLIDDNCDLIPELFQHFRCVLGKLEFLDSINKSIQKVIWAILQDENYPAKIIVDFQASKANRATITLLQRQFLGYVKLLNLLFQNENIAHLLLQLQIKRLLNGVYESSANNDVVLILRYTSIHRLEMVREVMEVLKIFYGQGNSNSESNLKFEISNVH